MREILYLGPFNTESVVRERHLPARNAAAYNRMLRLALAFRAAGAPIRIVSTGVAMQMGWSKTLWLSGTESEVDGVPVNVLPGLGMPYLGFLAEPLILACWFLARSIRRRPACLIVYNSTLASAVAVTIAKLIGVKVIYEVEDVPAWPAAGFERTSKSRALQQAMWMVSSKIQTPLSGQLLVPSKRFLDSLKVTDRKRNSALVVSGCMSIAVRRPALASYCPASRPLRVLFSGKLEAEHGYDLLLGAIHRILQQTAAHPLIEFHICGSAPKGSSEFQRPPAHPSVFYHGFVADDVYRTLLDSADIGLALQKADGIFKETRTPSKAYEFLASGKLLIAANVGDLAELFPQSAICLQPETAKTLADLLLAIAQSPAEFLPIAEHGLEEANERFSLNAVGRQLADAVHA